MNLSQYLSKPLSWWLSTPLETSRMSRSFLRRTKWGVRRYMSRRARQAVAPIIETQFHELLIAKTHNWDNVSWLGHPIWQSVPDLWTIQETIAEIKPALIIETGTNRGGSALFYAHLCDLMGKGRVVTVDVERMHSIEHPRIQFLLGGSTAPEIMEKMREAASESDGPVLIILDSDHSYRHVLEELRLYAPLVTVGSYLLAQDGIGDVLISIRSEMGPLPAIKRFIRENRNFQIDQERCNRFLITHHPLGWLRRVS